MSADLADEEESASLRSGLRLGLDEEPGGALAPFPERNAPPELPPAKRKELVDLSGRLLRPVRRRQIEDQVAPARHGLAGEIRLEERRARHLGLALIPGGKIHQAV